MSDLAHTGAGHAALMDRVYRYQRHIYDATRRHYLLGRDRLIVDLAPPPGGTVLEIGCGTARNLIKAARAYPRARFFGIDISDEMLLSGRNAIARAGLGERIILAHADATRFDTRALFGVDGFDRVFASYSLSMIPEWRAAQQAALAALRPHGRFSMVDFGQCEGLPRPVRRLLFAWLSRFHVTPRAGLVAALGTPVRHEALHGGYAWYAVVDPGKA